MKTADYIQLLKDKKGLASNYAVAKYMKLSTSTLTNYATGKTCFSDDIAIRFADELDINAGVVLADMHAEREHDPKIHNAWVQIARTLQQATAAVFMVVLLGIPTHNADAGTLKQHQEPSLQSIYYAN
jgi:plasmid maintenance system antidote protein VapI